MFGTVKHFLDFTDLIHSFFCLNIDHGFVYIQHDTPQKINRSQVVSKSTIEGRTETSFDHEQLHSGTNAERYWYNTTQQIACRVTRHVGR